MNADGKQARHACLLSGVRCFSRDWDFVCRAGAHAYSGRRACGDAADRGVGRAYVFFALSGFFDYVAPAFVEEFEQTGRIDLRAFYRRRVRRILPPAIIYLAALATMGPGLRWLPVSWGELAASLFFYRNVVQGGWYTGHFWSLSLEEQFLSGVAGFTRSRWGSSRARWAAIAMIAATAVWRVHVFSVDPGANIYRPDLLADHLLWGCLIALVWNRVVSTRAGVRAAIGACRDSSRDGFDLLAAAILAGFVCVLSGGGIYSGGGSVGCTLEAISEAGRGEL